MTREEAIKCIKVIESEYNREYSNTDISDVVSIDIDSVDIEALDMAIKALEQTRWIPVSEKLPEEYGEYMITWTTSHSMVDGKYGLLGIAEYELSGEYDHKNNRFKGEWLLDDYIRNYPDVKVTAWMPLPEPYRAESEDNA